MKASCLPPGVTVVANTADACEAFSSLVDRPAVNPGALKLKMRACLAVLAASCVPVFPAAAQQVTGEPGSPSAASTIDGQSLPAAPPPFGGTINLDAQEFEAMVAANRGAAQGRS